MYRTKASAISGLLITLSLACGGCGNSKPQTIQDREIIMKARLEEPEAKRLYKEVEKSLLALLENADKAFNKLDQKRKYEFVKSALNQYLGVSSKNTIENIKRKTLNEKKIKGHFKRAFSGGSEDKYMELADKLRKLCEYVYE